MQLYYGITMTYQDQLNFVIRFLNFDVSKLRLGDVLNFNDDLSQFLGWFEAEQGRKPPKPAVIDLSEIEHEMLRIQAATFSAFSSEEIAAIQTEIRSLLIHDPRAWVELQRNERYRESELKPEFVLTSKPLAFTLTPFPGLEPWTVSGITLRGNPRDAFILKAVLLLLTPPNVSRVRRCAREECGLWFIRTKRQEFCSRKCSNLLATRRRRAGLSLEERRQEQKKAYEERRRKRVGASRKVKFKSQNRKPRQREKEEHGSQRPSKGR
jgi:hypothetical protein